MLRQSAFGWRLISLLTITAGNYRWAWQSEANDRMINCGPARLKESSCTTNTFVFTCTDVLVGIETLERGRLATSCLVLAVLSLVRLKPSRLQLHVYWTQLGSSHPLHKLWASSTTQALFILKQWHTHTKNHYVGKILRDAKLVRLRYFSRSALNVPPEYDWSSSLKHTRWEVIKRIPFYIPLGDLHAIVWRVKDWFPFPVHDNSLASLSNQSQSKTILTNWWVWWIRRSVGRIVCGLTHLPQVCH